MRAFGVAMAAAIVGAATLTGSVGAPADAVSGAQQAAGVVCHFDDTRLDEISGMAPSRRHPGVLWLLNDSGGGPYLYAVDATTCRTKARVRLAGTTARDYESIATGVDRAGRDTIWVGDTGDNRSSWPEVRILAVAEPATLTDGASLPTATYRYTYPGRPYDAETLLVDPARPDVWVITKKLLGGVLWSIPLAPGAVTRARRVADAGGLVTDGAVSGDASRTVIRDYVWAYVYPGLPSAASFATTPLRVSLPLQPQGEAVTWSSDGQALLVASERDDRLLRVPLPATAWTATARIAAGLDPAAPIDPVATAGPDAPDPGPAADPPGSAAEVTGPGPVQVGVGFLLGAGALAAFLLAARRLRR